MKTSIYKLSGNVPEHLKGTEIKFREAENMPEITQLCGGEEMGVIRAAQATVDIRAQAFCRAAANKEDDDGNLIATPESIQADYDAWKYGTRQPGTGEAAVTRAKAKEADRIKEAANADPELAAKLAALGVTL